MEKTCSKCRRALPATFEYFHRYTDKHGAARLRAACRECTLRKHAECYYPAKRQQAAEAKAARLERMAAEFVGPTLPAPPADEFRCSKCRQVFALWFRRPGKGCCRGCAHYDQLVRKGKPHGSRLEEVADVLQNRERLRRKAAGLIVCRGCGETIETSKAYRNPTNGNIQNICVPCHRLRQRINRQQQKGLQLMDAAKGVRRSLCRGHSSPGFARLVGYSIADLRAHLERQFRDGMTWEAFNRGEIHIDHITPQRAFNLLDPDEFRACWDLPNLRPVWASENLSKGGKRFYLL